jgi:CBS domain containing-hemolysin-like protein
VRVISIGGSSSNIGTSALAMPVVAVRLTADRLGGRGSQCLGARSVVVVVIMLSLGGSLGLRRKSRSSALAVP